MEVDLPIFTDMEGRLSCQESFPRSLPGTAVIKTSDSSNKAYYGKEVRPVDILVKKDVSNPGSAALRQALKKAVK
jgi:hypothetical protein